MKSNPATSPPSGRDARCRAGRPLHPNESVLISVHQCSSVVNASPSVYCHLTSRLKRFRSANMADAAWHNYALGNYQEYLRILNGRAMEHILHTLHDIRYEHNVVQTWPTFEDDLNQAG